MDHRGGPPPYILFSLSLSLSLFLSLLSISLSLSLYFLSLSYLLALSLSLSLSLSCSFLSPSSPPLSPSLNLSSLGPDLLLPSLLPCLLSCLLSCLFSLYLYLLFGRWVGPIVAISESVTRPPESGWVGCMYFRALFLGVWGETCLWREGSRKGAILLTSKALLMIEETITHPPVSRKLFFPCLGNTSSRVQRLPN